MLDADALREHDQALTEAVISGYKEERDEARADVLRAMAVLEQFLVPAHKTQLSINDISALLADLQRKYTEVRDG